MALWNRKKVAQELGVSPARISQMQGEQTIAPPLRDENEGTGWPSTYVSDLSSRRSQERRTSKSLFGLPPATAPAERVDLAVVGNLFVQLFDRGDAKVGFISPLLDRGVPLGAFKPRLIDHTNVDEEGYLAGALAGAEALEIDPFEVYWSTYGYGMYSQPPRTGFSEVVIIDGADGEGPRLVATAITAASLTHKLGRPIPRFPFDIATEHAVEEWRKNDQVSPVEVEGRVEEWNDAMAAVLIAGMASPARGSRDVETTVAHLLRRVDPDRSGFVDSSPWVSEEEAAYTEWLGFERTPDFRSLTSTAAHYKVDPSQFTFAERRRSVMWLGKMLYHRYGRYGEQPDPVLAEACRRGMSSITSYVDRAHPGEQIRTPVFHEIRSFIPDASPVWLEYSRSLEPLMIPEDDQAPAVRHLEMSSSVPNARLMVDQGGTPVILEQITRFGEMGESARAAVAIAPSAKSWTGPYGQAEFFDELIVEANTQEGPIFVREQGKLYIAPFGEKTNGGFTHGYVGGGPSNLIAAINRFLQWAFPKTYGDLDRDVVRQAVHTTPMGHTLIIQRDELPCTWDFAPA